jgi:hypothetical protein
MSRWERWNPLAGVVAVVGMVIGFGLVTSSPSTNDSDAKITAYYATHSHQVRSLVSFFVFLAALLILLVFFSALRSRLVEAEDGVGRLGALAYGAGIVSVVLWFASIALFAGPGLAANDTGKFQLDPNTFRLVSDTGYEFWVGAVIAGALVVWVTSAVALRTGLLPRWFGWLGIVVGIIQLFAIVFVPVFVYWGWLLLVSALLTLRSLRPPAVAVPRAP